MCWDDIVLEKHDMRGSELIRVEREGREKRGRDGDMRNIVRKGAAISEVAEHIKEARDLLSLAACRVSSSLVSIV